MEALSFAHYLYSEKSRFEQFLKPFDLFIGPFSSLHPFHLPLTLHPQLLKPTLSSMNPLLMDHKSLWPSHNKSHANKYFSGLQPGSSQYSHKIKLVR